MVVAPQSKVVPNAIKMQDKLGAFKTLGNLSLAANSQVAALSPSAFAKNPAKAYAGMDILANIVGKDYSCPTGK